MKNHTIFTSNQSGRTIAEVVVMVTAGIVFVTLFVVVLSRLYAPDNSVDTLKQVRAYITALELNYKDLYGEYPVQKDWQGNAVADLEQYGCLVIYESTDTCQFNGKSYVQYPDIEGLKQLDEIVPLQSLSRVVSDREGEDFSAILYSSNGLKFRLQYPMSGDDVSCGNSIRNAYEIFSGVPEFDGVTICIYES